MSDDTLAFVRTYANHLRNNPLAHHMTDDFFLIWDGTMTNALRVKFFRAITGYRAQLIIPSVSWNQVDMNQFSFIFTLPENINPNSFQQVLLDNNLVDFTKDNR